jgi:putative flippase GtrA
VVNFLITRYAVFTESASSPLKQFLRFISVAIVGFFANLGLLDFFIRSLHFYPPVARITAALSLFFASFFIHKFFSFSLSLRHHATGAPGKPSN